MTLVGFVIWFIFALLCAAQVSSLLFKRTHTTTSTDAIVKSVSVRTEISCVLSCRRSKSCKYSAVKGDDGRSKVKECLHLKKLNGKEEDGDVPIILHQPGKIFKLT